MCQAGCCRTTRPNDELPRLCPARATSALSVAQTIPAVVARVAKAWADNGWPVEPDESGSGITAPFNAPSQGPLPWHVYRVEPRSATVALSTEPGGLTRFRF